MDFTMRAFVSGDWRYVAAVVLALGYTSEVTAEFKVADVQPKIAEKFLILDGNLDLGLSPKVEEALAKGIPLDVIIDIQLYKQRRFFWDKKIAFWPVQRRIQYHALSGQYLVSSGTGDAEIRESLLTLSEALKQLGALNDLKLELPDIPAEDGYSVDIRVSLDIEALPTPLRPVAYTSFAWHLNSGWTSWKVAR
jgi:hypothetical protein